MQGLGVEIVFLGLQGVHPPPEVAEDYQKVIGAVQGRQADILGALAERNNILASLTGSVSQSNELYALAREYQQAKEEGDAGRIAEVRERLNDAYLRAKGDIFKTLSEADSYAFERAKIAEADGNRFNDQILAYKASPEIYKRQQRLSMLEEALEKTRKYVIIADESDSQVFIIDLKEKLAPDLYDLGLESDEGGK
jgi:regulator of protease activity HflC (stomatin/prohibitin superfamily)